MQQVGFDCLSLAFCQNVGRKAKKEGHDMWLQYMIHIGVERERVGVDLSGFTMNLISKKLKNNDVFLR